MLNVIGIMYTEKNSCSFEKLRLNYKINSIISIDAKKYAFFSLGKLFEKNE